MKPASMRCRHEATGSSPSCQRSNVEVDGTSLQFRCDDGVGFDLDQHVGRDQSRNFNHRRGRTNVTEYLSVSTTSFFPAANVSDVGAGAHNIANAGTGLRQSAFDVLQRLHSLRVHIIFADDLTVSAGGH